MDAAIWQTTAPFTYDTLPDAAKYIRLLEVLDYQYSEDVKVRCRITTWPVDNAPSYYAISYTWGDPAPGSTILVNSQAFRIRTNCEFVLKQAYWYKKTSHYWVDAICINQRDLEEKSVQVSIMGDIYKLAGQVLACVGDHADDSAFLIHKLKQHAFTKRTSFARRLHRGESAFRLSFRFQLRQRFSTTIRFLHAVLCFITRPYFTRLWILQELKNAQDATFLCGSDAIPRHFIHQMSEEMLGCTLQELTGLQRAINVPRKFPIIRRFYPVEAYQRDWCVHYGTKDNLLTMVMRAWFLVGFNRDIETILEAAIHLECQEMKDKIFGLSSLIDWGTSSPLIPDYTQTDFQVAVSFFTALLYAFYRDDIQSHWTITHVSFQVWNLLRLNDNSPGVPSAVEARRIEPGSRLANEGINFRHTPSGINFRHTPSKHSVSIGWRVSSGHLTRSESGFSTWTLPESELGEVYLPFWAQDDDWIVMVGARYQAAYVLVREFVRGLGGPLIGHTFQDSHNLSVPRAPEAYFRIYWDAEDLVIYTIIQESWLTWGTSSVTAGLVGALNTAICRKETPGSSCAMRCE